MTDSAREGGDILGSADLDDGWIYACRREQLGGGDKLEVTLSDGRLVLLICLQDEKIVACCADCPHQGTPLIDAMVEGNTLLCPTHFWQWDLITGEPVEAAELPLPVFAVMERSGNLYLRLEPRS